MSLPVFLAPPELALAASNPCQFFYVGFLLLLPFTARNSTNTARILLEPILIIFHFIGAIQRLYYCPTLAIFSESSLP